MKIKTSIISILGVISIGGLLLNHDFSGSPSKVNSASQSPSQHLSKDIDDFGSVRQWQSVSNNTKLTQNLPDEIEVSHIQTQANAFDQLKNGEKLTLYIPQEDQSYIGTVEKNHQQFDGLVQVSSGSIDDGQPFSSFTVTKGSELTLVMVATGEKVYQIEIDNKTGAGTVIDDQSLDHLRKHDDGQVTPPEGIS